MALVIEMDFGCPGSEDVATSNRPRKTFGYVSVKGCPEDQRWCESKSRLQTHPEEKQEE